MSDNSGLSNSFHSIPTSLIRVTPNLEAKLRIYKQNKEGFDGWNYASDAKEGMHMYREGGQWEYKVIGGKWKGVACSYSLNSASKQVGVHIETCSSSKCVCVLPISWYTFHYVMKEQSIYTCQFQLYISPTPPLTSQSKAPSVIPSDQNLLESCLHSPYLPSQALQYSRVIPPACESTHISVQIILCLPILESNPKFIKCPKDVYDQSSW